MPFLLDYAARYPLYAWTARRLKYLEENELQLIGHQLLLGAACRQDLRMVKLLLEHKVDPNFRVSGETTWYYILSKASANDHQTTQTQWSAIIGALPDHGADTSIKVDIFAQGKGSLGEIIKDNAQWWTREPADTERLIRLVGTAQKQDKVSRWRPDKRKSVLK
ncbi:hypothetical protein BDZ45DRAFT_745823 [Acephala macrosclerotiorum]|nr:hypothetical protein BDZ45DRAFT_745823 [Acephala macrosclerotiorum]